jgi:hypothetical protein
MPVSVTICSKLKLKWLILYFYRSQGIEGNVVRWSTSEWQLENMVKEDLAFEHICKPPNLGNLLFPTLRNMSSSVLLCKRMNSNITVIKSKSTQDDLTRQFWDRVGEKVAPEGE